MKYLALFAVLICVSTVFTQETVTWKPDCAACESLTRNGVTYLTIKSDGFNVTAVGEYGKNVSSVYLIIQNVSKDRRIEFDPANVFAAEYDGQAAKPLVRLTPEEAAKVKSGSKWKDFQERLRANNASQQSATIVTDTGRTATVTTTDPNARAAAEAKVEARKMNITTRVLAEALRANTILPGEDAYGFIHFKQKKPLRTSYAVRIGDKGFIFHFVP
jgi:hypothetical protein